jgi:hypothetical protein
VGTWGVGLYSNDLVLDLRDDFAQVVRAPWDAEQLYAWAESTYPALDDPADDEHSDMLLVIAHLFWRYGIEHDPANAAAREIIASGADLAAKRRLGMTERDLRRRRAVLIGLDSQLSSANPKPYRRRVRRRPESLILELGDCIVYPTAGGALRNPYVTPGREAAFFARHRWEPDGWGAAVVLERAYEFDVFARYLVALVADSLADRPTPVAIAGMSILHTGTPPGKTGPSTERPRRCLHWISLSLSHLHRMHIEVVGRLQLDTELVQQELAATVPGRRLDHSLANVARFGAIEHRLVPANDPLSRYLRRGP